MSYTISEFAKIIGVTTDTLRVYEKKGIIKPLKDDKNNYRYFDDLDCRNILISRWYRSLQVSLKNVEGLISHPNKLMLTNLIEKQRYSLEEEIEQKSNLLKKMNEINDELNQVDLLLNKCYIKTLPGFYRLKQTNKTDLLDNAYKESLIKEWMNWLPYTFYSIRINQEDLLKKRSIIDYDWGLAINDGEMELFNLTISDNVDYTPPNQYISSIFISRDEDILNSIQYMLKYIDNNNFKINGDSIGRIILVDEDQEGKKTYLEINIPIE